MKLSCRKITELRRWLDTAYNIHRWVLVHVDPTEKRALWQVIDKQNSGVVFFIDPLLCYCDDDDDENILVSSTNAKESEWVVLDLWKLCPNLKRKARSNARTRVQLDIETSADKTIALKLSLAETGRLIVPEWTQEADSQQFGSHLLKTNIPPQCVKKAKDSRHLVFQEPFEFQSLCKELCVMDCALQVVIKSNQVEFRTAKQNSLQFEYSLEQPQPVAVLKKKAITRKRKREPDSVIQEIDSNPTVELGQLYSLPFFRNALRLVSPQCKSIHLIFRHEKPLCMMFCGAKDVVLSSAYVILATRKEIQQAVFE